MKFENFANKKEKREDENTSILEKIRTNITSKWIALTFASLIAGGAAAGNQETGKDASVDTPPKIEQLINDMKANIEPSEHDFMQDIRVLHLSKPDQSVRLHSMPGAEPSETFDALVCEAVPKDRADAKYSLIDSGCDGSIDTTVTVYSGGKSIDSEMAEMSPESQEAYQKALDNLISGNVDNLKIPFDEDFHVDVSDFNAKKGFRTTNGNLESYSFENYDPVEELGLTPPDGLDSWDSIERDSQRAYDSMMEEAQQKMSS